MQKSGLQEGEEKQKTPNVFQDASLKGPSRRVWQVGMESQHSRYLWQVLLKFVQCCQKGQRFVNATEKGCRASSSCRGTWEAPTDPEHAAGPNGRT